MALGSQPVRTGLLAPRVRRSYGTTQTSTGRKSETVPQVKPAEYDAGREVYGRHAIMRTLVLGEIDFCLGPNFLEEFVLTRGVPDQIASEKLFVSGGWADA